MAALIAENFRFLSLFFKSKDVMIFNGLVALGTVGSQELFSVVAFHCPCSPARNYLYGLTAIGVPALALFLIGVVAILVFLTKCFKHYCSPLSYRQEAYWAQYRTNEDQLFQRTAEVHSRVLAANNVRRFFGFVALNKDDEELVTKFPVEGTQPRPQWNAITGVYLYRENQGLPLYSRLHFCIR